MKHLSPLSPSSSGVGRLAQLFSRRRNQTLYGGGRLIQARTPREIVIQRRAIVEMLFVIGCFAYFDSCVVCCRHLVIFVWRLSFTAPSHADGTNYRSKPKFGVYPTLGHGGLSNSFGIGWMGRWGSQMSTSLRRETFG